MDASPLSQQARPEVFKPKVVELYEILLRGEDQALTDGFWRELFLLRPEDAALHRLLDGLSPDALLHHEIPTQDLFYRATLAVKDGKEPSDENALDTLTVFLETVLNKKYASPSSDTITVLSSIQGADTALSSFVAAVDESIRHGRTLEVRRKAVRAAIAAVAGAYQTGLVSYFINRDLFPSLIKLIYDAEDLYRLFAPCALLGLLVNYNKFEFQNPYQLRLEDFVDDGVIRKLSIGMSSTFLEMRDDYLEVQEDLPEGWDISSTLTYFGLSRITPGSKSSPGTLSAEEARTAFANLPSAEASIMLATYDFANANSIFCSIFVTPWEEKGQDRTPFNGFLTFASYLLQNAYRNARASLYSCLCLTIIRILVEDFAAMKGICDPEITVSPRLCRQVQPVLPVVRSKRPRVCVLMDILIDGINHNLRRRLDIELYTLLTMPLIRILSYLSAGRTRLTYHWAELWRSLLNLAKFLTSYADSIKAMGGVDALLQSLVSVLELALTTGEMFLPDAKSYDDLFYKIVEAGDILGQFRDQYGLSKRPETSAGIEALLSVSQHYKRLLEEKKGRNNSSISPREVTKIIKEGYDTLALQTKDGADQWEKYREADHRNLVKRVTRTAVQDLRALLDRRT